VWLQFNVQKSTDEENEPGIILDEVRAAIAKMKKNKSPGIDDITAEENQAATEDVGIVADMAATTTGLEQGGIPARLVKGSDCVHTEEKG